MEGDDCPAGTLHCARQIEILFVPRKAVKQNDSGMRASPSGQIEHCVQTLAIA